MIKENGSLELNENIEVLNGVLKLKKDFFLHQKESGQQQFQYFQGIKSVSKANIETFKKNIANNLIIANQLNFKYLHVVYPAKAVVYQNEFKKYGIKINPIITKEHSVDSVIYGKSLIDHFEFDDTHHNDKGLYEIIVQAFTALNIDISELIPSFEIKMTKGDLGQMYGCPPHEVDVFNGFHKGLQNSKIQKFSLAEYLPGNSGHIDYHLNTNAIIKKRLVLFGDSYFRKSLNILNMIFEEVIYFRTPYIMLDLVKTLDPDIVWTGNAERYLVDVPDSNFPKPYFLNYLNANFRAADISKRLTKVFHLLFLGRNNQQFVNWKNSQVVTVSYQKQLNPLDIHIDDLKTEMDINLCYRMAINFESENIHYSYHLITLALKARPEGPLLKAKYDEYKRLVSC